MNKVSHLKVTSSTLVMRELLLGGLAFFALVSTVLAQEEDSSRKGIEEVVVTAQRSEQGLQDVPIAVTALSGDMLEERQVINPSDLQLNTPNVSFTATNFGASSVSIRGIGRLVISSSGENGVSNHVNEIPIESNQNAIEFFDVDRVEILRGPQGTLFGRNATGGAVNVVTKMPNFEGISGFVDAEYGDFDNVRFKGAFNLPVTDKLAFRFAGFDLNRDGYIRNLAFNQPAVNIDGEPTGETLPGIKPTVDGRNITAFRITGLWDVADNASIWLQYNNFRENDDRARITNQVCKRTALPTTGCEPNEEAFEQPHLGTFTGNLFAMFAGTLPPVSGATNFPGIPGVLPPLVYNYPRPELGLRTMHTDFQPIFKQNEDNFLFGMDIELDQISIGILSAYQDSSTLTRQDYSMDVGPTLNAVPGNLSGNFPTVQLSTTPLGDITGPCALIDPDNPGLGLAGSGPAHRAGGGTAAGADPVVSPCIHPSDQTRTFAYDQTDADTQYWTAEVTAASSFDGKLNFNLGVSTYKFDRSSDYYVTGNTLDLVEYLGVAGNRLYPGYFDSRTNKLTADGIATFGEVYFDLTDTLKLTAGLRYNQDNKDLLDSGVLANSVFVAPLSRYIRATLAPLLAPAMAPELVSTLTDSSLAEPTTVEGRLLARYNTAEAIMATLAALGGPDAATAGAAAVVGLFSAVPIVPLPGESRAINQSPTTARWTELTGRVGIDWNITNDSLIYGFFSRGYKPGGFNPNLPDEFRTPTSPFRLTFAPETINAFEIGSKNTLLDGRMTLNGTAFLYDYKGLQVTRIVNNSSFNENIDANVSGVELELVWLPHDNLTLDLAYSFLDSSIKGGSVSVDPIGRTVGDTDNEWRILTNLGGALTGVNYIARAAVLTEGVLAGIAGLNGTPFAAAPGAAYPAAGSMPAIPVHMSRAALEGVLIAAVPGITAETIGDFVRDGLDTQLDGNSLPNSPEHTIHVGAAWKQNMEAFKGSLTLRWDFYWQSDSFARDFNTVGDKIDSWSQHNLSLTYNNNSGSIQGKLWARNLFNDENVTGKYLTSDTSGFYRNYFLTEPRIFGASIRYNFGL